jgi:class 3 adenylate cyclase
MASDTGLSRGIKAVLFSDMKGYSSKMSQDEDRAFRLLEEHDRLVTPIVTHHHGNLIKKIGDAIMAAFTTASDAVNCAIEIQEVLAGHNQGKEQADQIVIRIGIHVGEVMEKEGDLFGHGVNIAARIEPHAQPGGIAVSQTIVSMLQAQPQFNFRSGGDHKVKNIQESLSIFHVERGSANSVGRPALTETISKGQGLRLALGLAAAVMFIVGVLALKAPAPEPAVPTSPAPATAPTEPAVPLEKSPRDKLLEAFEQRGKSFRVGLAELEPVGCEAALAQTITEHLGATLRGIPKVRIEQLSEKTPQDTEAIGTWAMERGKALNLEFIIVGAVGFLGSKSVLSLRRFSTETGQIDRRSYRLVDSTDALLAEVDAAWLELSSERLNGEPTSSFGGEAGAAAARPNSSINKVIYEAKPSLKDCYKSHGNKKSGKVVILLEIQPTGKVASTKMGTDEIGEQSFEQCVLGEAKTWLFPSANEKQSISFPFIFSD